MNILDIIILAFFVWAVYSGCKRGVVVQIVALAGLVVSCWLALRFGYRAGCLFRLEGAQASVAGFIAVFVLSMIVLTLLGRLCRGFFRFVGLGSVDKLLGVLLSLVKMFLILSIVLSVCDRVNRQTHTVRESLFTESKLYRPMQRLMAGIAPYWDEMKSRVTTLVTEPDEGGKEER